MLSCFYFSVLEVTKNFLASDPLPTDIGYVVCTHVYIKNFWKNVWDILNFMMILGGNKNFNELFELFFFFQEIKTLAFDKKLSFTCKVDTDYLHLFQLWYLYYIIISFYYGQLFFFNYNKRTNKLLKILNKIFCR